MIPIIFFDEIDSRIGGIKDSYPYFLTAMYDGLIHESGNEWKLGDAIFFFAASKSVKDLVNQDGSNVKNIDLKLDEVEQPISYSEWIGEQKEAFENAYHLLANENKSPKKLKDFLNRIDITVFLPPSNVTPNGSEDEANRQAHYLAVSLILKHFPDLRLVDPEVLTILAWDLIRVDSNRQIENYIFNSSVPGNDKFCLRHLPEDFLNRKEVKAKLEQTKTDRGTVNEYIPIGKSPDDFLLR